LETQLGILFPDGYRFILLNYGESRFSNDIWFQGEDGGRYCFGSFFGIESLKENLDSAPYDFPPGLVAIGDEGLGNLYCLGISGTKLGQVWYWNHEVGWGEQAERYREQQLPIPEHIPFSCLRLLAPTFDSLVARLEVVTE
jgi:hypothetical protein